MHFPEIKNFDSNLDAILILVDCFLKFKPVGVWFNYFPKYRIVAGIHIELSSKQKQTFALFVTSKIEFSISPILQFSMLQNAFKIKEQCLKYFLSNR